MAINQLKTGALLSYISIILNNIIGLLYTPFMLRMMGQSEYGLYSLVASVVAYLTILDFGFGNAIIRYTAKFRAENRLKEQYEMFGMFLFLYSAIGIFTLLIGLCLYFNVDFLFERSMNMEELNKIRIMMLLMVFNIAITFPFSIFGSIITAYENFIFQKAINIVRIILNPIVMCVMLLMGYRAIGMVVVTTLFNVLTLLINCWYCYHRLHIHVIIGRFNWTFLKEIMIYSFWIFLNAIMDRIYWSSGQFILGIYAGAKAVAIYAVAISLENIYMSFSTAISGVFLPRITSMITQKENEKSMSDLFIRTGRIQYIIMSFILIGFILFGKQFIIIWAGSDYSEAYYITLLFFVPLTIPLIQNLGITILQARNQMKFRSVSYVIIAIISLGLSVFLVRYYGGIGCALSTAFALCIGQILIMNIYYFKKVNIDIPAFWREIGKMSVVPILIGIVGYVLLNYFRIESILTLFLGIVLFSIIYLPAFWHLSMNSYERNLFLKPLKKVLKK
ncbi:MULTISPECIES: oligosaccharide flippase family protein [unclassified Bacteroides]|jgi:O-antigen/teichoic acid export membrane protein|uniref:oligosaccharide flippase family protein n=1 Tax=unclassified Bacteroides TaxID=2646097 RepID=UPI000E814521|nr:MULTISPECIES: oligosaccharide flippase family protein [unclassified Bacteroides]RGN49263.1 flippase [Bacteroides sp. OM05-12]RHR83373.1 flippase [Bacteroides sp. AF16-49]